MKNITKLIVLLVITHLSVFYINSAQAVLSVDKTIINSETGSARVTVSFPSPVTGDLYLATIVNGNFLFLSNKGYFTNKKTAFISNSYFSTPIHVLDVNSEGIPSGTYSLYQVVVKSGTDPLDVNNWIGGFASLSELKFAINLSIDTNDTVAHGKTLYKSLCADSGCHGSNPVLNKHHVLEATSLSALKMAIRRFPNDMGALSGVSDTDLQAVVDYLKAL